MSYRTDFWTNAVATFFVEFAAAYFLWTAIFRETGREEVAGFSLEAMIVYYVAAILLGKVVKGDERDRTISEDIYEGSLTRYLLYPSSYFGFKYAEHVGSIVPSLVEMALFGAVALALLPTPPDVHVSAASVAMAAVSVAISNLLHFLLMFPLRAVAFWADNVWSLEVMYRFVSQLLGGLLLPLTLFPEWAERGLALLPFRYLYYFPAVTLLGQVPPAEWARGVAVSAAWCAAAALVGWIVWRRGTRQYTGVGI
jgi:ABC-2 type transport system permease protein